MFAGSCIHALDAKRRITVPSEWRAELLEPVLYMAPGIDHDCVYAFPLQAMMKKLESAREASLADEEAQRFLRMWFSRSQKVEIDAQGRIRVRDELLAFAGITTQAAMVSAPGRFELWSPERWQGQDMHWDRSAVKKAVSSIGW